MTQEEKVKAYDKALEYAMIYYKNGNEDMKMMMKTCFPVLVEESEDERIRKAIHIYLDWLDGRNKDYHPKGVYTIKDMIAWLEKQGEQNPAAWSEEDETVLNNLIYALANDRIGNNRDEYVNWLKSLKGRYTWKPSEEQMNALEHFVRSVGESGYASPYDNDTKFLYSLIAQLKKLREE